MYEYDVELPCTRLCTRCLVPCTRYEMYIVQVRVQGIVCMYIVGLLVLGRARLLRTSTMYDVREYDVPCTLYDWCIFRVFFQNLEEIYCVLLKQDLSLCRGSTYQYVGLMYLCARAAKKKTVRKVLVWNIQRRTISMRRTKAVRPYEFTRNDKMVSKMVNWAKKFF